MLRQKRVVEVRLVVLTEVVSTSAATTLLHGENGGHFSTWVLSFHEGGHSTTAGGVLSLQSEVISLLRIMTWVIPLRSEFRFVLLFIVATGCPSERRPQKTFSCYGG